MDFYQTSLSQLHDDLVNKKISATELTRETFDHIKGNEDQVKAFISLNGDQALKRAAEIDAKGISADQLTAGVPLAVKDNILTKGPITTVASKMLENFSPVYDATVVEKLNAADYTSVGETSLDEFIMGSSIENSIFFMAHNPWDLTRVPGSSPGGSAATVAAGDVLGAPGTDTGGSIRMPTSFNGVIEMKPTYGCIPRWGITAFGSSFDQVGWLTQNVKDNALLIALISGNDERDMTFPLKEVPDWAVQLNENTSVKGLRIAVPKECFDGLDENVQEVIKAALDHLESLDVIVDEVSSPHTRYGVPAYYILASSEVSSNLQRYDGIRYGFRAADVKNLEDVYVRSRSEGFGEEVKQRVMLGTFSLSAGFYDAYFDKAAKIRRLITQDFEDVFKGYDVIVGATGTSMAFKIGAEIDDLQTMYMSDMLAIPVNTAGLPAVSIPAGFSAKNDMPVGLQIIGKVFDEQTVYSTGYVFEQTTDFHKKTPKLGGQN